MYGKSRLPGLLGTFRAGAHRAGMGDAEAMTEGAFQGSPPSADGAVGPFDISRHALRLISEQGPSVILSRERRAGTYEVVYVNGMNTSPETHLGGACMIAAVSGGPVTGIYNASEGGGKDFWQSVNDKGTSAFGAGFGSWLRATFGGKTEAEIVEGFAKKIAEGDGSILGIGVFGKLFSKAVKGNPATASLLRYLYKRRGADLRLVGHSQGNIIIANAVNYLVAVCGKEAAAKFQIVALASPVRYWTDASALVKLQLSYDNDGVSWLSLRTGYRSGWYGFGRSMTYDPYGRVVGIEPMGWKVHRALTQFSTHGVGNYIMTNWKRLTAFFD